MKKRHKKNFKLANKKAPLSKNKDLTNLPSNNNQKQKSNRTAHTDRNTAEKKTDNPFNYLTSLNLFKSLAFIVLAELIIVLPLIYFTYYATSYLERVPAFVLYLTRLISLSASIFHFFISVRILIYFKTFILDTFYRNKLLFEFKYWSILVIASASLTLLYSIGLVDGLTNFVKLILPIIGQNISYGISTFITWVMSGVIGNAAFALLRRLFYKMQNRNISNSSEKIKE